MLSLRNAAGIPAIVDTDGGCRTLTRVMLGAGRHSEAWLQSLIFDHPQLLPILEIEPAFHDPIPVACEVPCGHGYIDNLYVTPRGNIVLVEAKLWKNPQARRELVAQVLDYVAALMGMGYEQFEAALASASPRRMTASLYDLVRDHPAALDEAAFIDAVSANLARGRVLALAAGDGIRSEAQALAALLQSHAGAHFTFALVELGIWEDGLTGDLLCLPRTLSQTVMIERGIVVHDGVTPQVRPLPVEVAARSRPQSISQAQFNEQLAASNPALPALLADFIDRLEPLGVYADQKASLTLKSDLGGTRPVNLGSIDKTGRLWTDHVHTSMPLDLARRYNQQLAELIGGVVPGAGPPRVTTNGKSAPFITALLPLHAPAWAEIIRTLLVALAEDAGQQAA